MKDYQALIDKYSFVGYSMFSEMEDRQWGKGDIAQAYIERYWLDRKSYKDGWQRLHESIFALNKQLPEMLFKRNFEFICLLGGVMFEQKDFEQFRTCLKKISEKDFLIVQDTFGAEAQQLICSFKMKYPVDIEWDEMMSGNYISTALFELPENNYYIFGSSNQWGMYVANDYIDESVDPAGTPIRIIGFDPKHRAIFREAFGIPEGDCCENLDDIPEEERPNLKDWIPEIYRR